MLTKQQISNLNPLCQHPKFGQLLRDASEVWKQQDINPSAMFFGVHTENNIWPS